MRERRATRFLLPWERLLWSGRPGLLAGSARLRTRYYLTDFRLLIVRRYSVEHELAVHDVDAVDLRQNPMQRFRGTSTLVVRSRRRFDATIRLTDIRQGPQLALVLQLLAADRLGERDGRFVEEAIGRDAHDPFRRKGVLITASVTLILSAALGLVALGDAKPQPPMAYAPDDAIYPGGKKRSRADIVRFMETEVMPFARQALGPLKGGADRVGCETCHGRDARSSGWRMPAVQALPEPALRLAGLERHSATLDAQIRNAIYGYLAREDNEGRAAYMRGVVMPGMARLLHRPPYDFTRPYEYNRSRAAFGCYHCHKVH